MTRRFLPLFLVVFGISCGDSSPPAPPPSPVLPVVGFSFDADDNLFNLPTQIMLFNKNTGEERGVSTADFALIRNQIGKPGEFENFELRQDRKTGSLRFFGDEIGDGVNYFLTDLQKAMDRRKPDWRAASFPAFVAAMTSPRSAEHTTIITARAHEPETIQAALQFLQDQRYLERTPPTENIWTVTNGRFPDRFRSVFGVEPPSGDAASPSQRKAAIMREILNDIEEQPLEGTEPVIRPDAKDANQTGDYHLWGFSDDDFGNFMAALKLIQEGLDAGQWPHIKITLFFTGLTLENGETRAVVLQPNAEPRKAFPEEEGEWQRIVGRE